VQQNQRPTRADLAVGQLGAVMAGEPRNVHSEPDLNRGGFRAPRARRP
jgi:hypothetical protein